MAFTAEQLAKIEAQRAYFASDELLRERAALWRDLTPEQCLVAAFEEFESAIAMIEHLQPDVRARALEPEPLPADTEALLESLWARRRR